MSRTGALILLGILIILTPFSGLPVALRSLLFVVFGASVAALGLSMRARDARKARESLEAALSPAAANAPVSEPSPATEQDIPTGVSPI